MTQGLDKDLNYADQSLQAAAQREDVNLFVVVFRI